MSTPTNGDYGRRFHILPAGQAVRFGLFSCQERGGISEWQTKRKSPARGKRPRQSPMSPCTEGRFFCAVQCFREIASQPQAAELYPHQNINKVKKTA